MMKKLTKSKNLATSLVVFSVVILVTLNLLAAICVGFFSSSAMNEKEDAILQQTAENAEVQIADFMAGYSLVTEMLVNDPKMISLVKSGSATTPISASPDFEMCTAIMQNTADRYADIMGVYIGSVEEDAYYSGTGEKSQNAMHERPFYTAVTENRLIVTQPYVDVFTGKYCVSIGTPIQENGKTIGVICLDIDMNQLSHFTTNLAFGNTGEVILLGADNTVIGYENADMIGKNLSEMGMSDKLTKELASPSGKIVRYSLNRTNRVGTVIDMPDYG